MTTEYRVSDTPWSRFSASDYTPAQWRRACLIDTGEGPVDSKSRYKLPVREPGGAVNRNGVHAAAAALAGARGGVQASVEQKRSAARKLISLYRNQLNEDPPESLQRLAGGGRSNPMATIERRYTPLPVEARGGDNGGRRIGGYAAVFNRPSKNLGGFVESVASSAFNDSRGRGWPDVMARYNHDDNMMLGTVAGGTLRLSIDDTGLDYEVVPPPARADVVELVERGDVRKSSFAFRRVEDSWERSDQGYPHRILEVVQLVDVAPVNRPAYADSTAGMRAALESLAEFMDAPIEDVLQRAEKDELRSFFERTDVDGGVPPKPQPTLGAAARMSLLGRERDPYDVG